MSLRTKILTGYLIFIAALTALGGWSAWRLREMGDMSRRIITNNYDSVVAAQDMKESLERQDSAAVFFLLGERTLAEAQLREHRARFDAAFEKEANNITEPGEWEAVEALCRDRDAYYQLFDAFLAGINNSRSDFSARPQTQGNESRTYYFGRLKPQFDRLRGDCEVILQLNQRAMVAKSEEAAGVARRWFPARIAGGDLNAKAKVDSHDELGLLAAEYNRMAERIRQLRRSDLGKLVVAQQTTEAAIDSLYDPVLVTDAQGCVTKLNPAAEEVFGPEAAYTGKHVEEVVRDSRIAVAVAETLRSQRPVAAEDAAAVLPLRVDGSRRAFRLRTTPMRDGEGHLLGAVTLLEDITHLREIDRLKSEFIATASHELRTPLTSVQMGVHLLLEGAAGELNEKQLEVLAA